jgi:CBS domain-containing protein
MDPNKKVTDIMTLAAITVRPDDSIVRAADLMLLHHFDGLPVVDENNILLGLVTGQNLIAQKTNIHLPTVLALLKSFDLYRRDKKFAQNALDKVLSLKVSDVMSTEPPLLYEGETVDGAIMHLSKIHGVNPTSIVTESRKLLGVITRTDIFKLYQDKYRGQHRISYSWSSSRRLPDAPNPNWLSS